MSNAFVIREATPDEHEALGQLMIRAYASLEGFPTPAEEPAYYQLLADVGQFASGPDTRVLIAADDTRILGGVVYFSDLARYGATALVGQEQATSAFRLLAVDPDARGLGVGRALAERCVTLAREHAHRQVIIHSSEPQHIARAMYARMGFVRAPELDFPHGDAQILGFRLAL